MTQPASGRAAPSENRVELILGGIEELFVAPSPSPLENRFETQSGMDRILDQMQAGSTDEVLVIDVIVPASQADRVSDDDMSVAVEGYCDQRARNVRREKDRLERKGRIELLFGLLFLAACLAMSSAVAALVFGPAWLNQFLVEGLIIVGWIALWHPVDMLLFERWPLRTELRQLERIRRASIRVRPSG